MFKTLRWRLTLWFVLLSLLVYSTLAGLGTMFFYAGLTSAIDDELQSLSQDLLSEVDADNSTLALRTWPSHLKGEHKHRNPIKLLAAVQLFDKNGRLVGEYGLKGIPRLMTGTVEVNTHDYAKRSTSVPVYNSEGKLAGYLQVQLTTKLRDHAVQQLGITMAIIGPLLLLALGVSGYFFSGKAAEPIEETFDVLRQFISDSGHELGTPLAIIQAATENLSAQLEDTPHAARLAIISRTTDRMSRLVSDLTYLAKVDARQAKRQISDLSLDSLVTQCIEEFEDRYADKNVKLITGEIDSVRLSGESDSLHRVLTNLLENALRYTDEGGQVSVSLKVTGRIAKIVVEDSGIGIPAESLPHLFDRFYRVDKSRSREKGGFGLGLAIVKAIVEQHRGYVEVASEVNKGTRFAVVVPTV